MKGFRIVDEVTYIIYKCLACHKQFKVLKISIDEIKCPHCGQGRRIIQLPYELGV